MNLRREEFDAQSLTPVVSFVVDDRFLCYGPRLEFVDVE